MKRMQVSELSTCCTLTDKSCSTRDHRLLAWQQNILKCSSKSHYLTTNLHLYLRTVNSTVTVCLMFVRYALTTSLPFISPFNREELKKENSFQLCWMELPQLKPNLKLKGPEPNGLKPWKPWKPPWKLRCCWLSGSMGSSPWSNLVLISTNKIKTKQNIEVQKK